MITYDDKYFLFLQVMKRTFKIKYKNFQLLYSAKTNKQTFIYNLFSH
jgi:hypothetical protein